jgi:type I restriction enzyme S subunit
LKTVPLGSVGQINPRRPQDLDERAFCSFVPMESVDESLGAITTAAIRPIKDVEKGYTYFRDGDVLFAKITPCMENGKCAIAKNLVNGIGFGSTEFHVVRPKQGMIPQWLFYFLRQQSTRNEAARHMTGTAGQQRVPTRFLQEVQIPLPPLPEQQRIAAILAKADRLRRLRRYALTLSDTYLQSVFLDMFGDPVTNPMGWETGSFDHVISGTRNGTGQRSPVCDDGTIVLRIKDVGTGSVNYSEPRRIGLSVGAIRTYGLEHNDLLLVRVNGNPNLVGRAALFRDIGEPVAFSDHVIRVKLKENRIVPEYLLHLLNCPYGRTEILANVTTTAGQFTINRAGLSRITLPYPPSALQNQFARTVHKVERLHVQQREALRQAEHLFQTLLHRAFSGEL